MSLSSGEENGGWGSHHLFPSRADECFYDTPSSQLSYLFSRPLAFCLLRFRTRFYVVLSAAALILYSVMAVPFRLGFRVIDTPVLFWSDAFIDLLFGIDIVATFCTAFYDDNLVNYEHLKLKLFFVLIGG